MLTGPVDSVALFTCLYCQREEKCVSGNDWSCLFPWQISSLLKDKEKIQASPAAALSEDDLEIKKIKKVKAVI